MESLVDKLYQEYYYSRLDLVFGIQEYLDSLKISKPQELGENQIYDIDGKIIDVDSIGEFHDGYAVVTKKYIVENQYSSEFLRRAIKANYPHPDTTEYIKYNYIDKDYKLYPYFTTETDKSVKNWFDNARDFRCGIGVVKGYGHEWYLNKERGMLGGSSFNKAYDFIGNIGLIMEERGYWFMDATGHWPAFNIAWDHHTIIHESEYKRTPVNQYVHFIQGVDRYNGVNSYINMNKSFILSQRINTESGERKKKFDTQIACTTIDLKDYLVTKKRFGYELKNRNDKYRVKKEPIKVFDNRFTLCLDKKNIFLFDRKKELYFLIGNVENTFFEDNLIVNYLKDGSIVNAFLIYNEELLTITDYYDLKLKDIDRIKINHGIKISTKKEFAEANSVDIAKAIKDAETQQAVDSYENEKKQVMDSIQQGFKIIDEKYNKGKERIKFDDILEPYNGHKRIKPIYLEKGYLKKLDLSNVSFRDVEMSDIDFSECNIYFYPGTAFKHNLSNSNFEGVYFPVSTDFTGVNICGAKFTNSGNPAVFDINKEALSCGIYDDKTTLNGTPLVELLTEEKKRRRV